MKTETERINLPAIVLAGVHAWDESPLERDYCRPLLPVVGAPLAGHLLGWLVRQGIDSATICANSDTGTFRECIGEGKAFGMTVDYCEDVMPRGPAGCVRDAAERSDADLFVVADATLLSRVAVGEVLTAHRNSEASLTVVVTSRSRTYRSCAATLEPVGIYVISRSAIEHVPEKGYQDLKEMLIPLLYRKGLHVAPYIVPADSSLRVRTMASYLAANSWVAERLAAAPPADYVQLGRACVHKSARVASSARLAGPVVVGPDCIVAENVTLAGPTTIGANCRIDANANIRHTTLWSHCRVGANACIDDSVLTDGARIGRGMAVRETVWPGEPEFRGQWYWMSTGCRSSAMPTASGEGAIQSAASTVGN